MGKYFVTILYKGIISTPCSYNSYKNEYILNKNKKIYHDNFVVLANIDPIIEQHEIFQGFVRWSEIENLLNNNPTLKEKFGEIDGNQDIFICQASFWTLDNDNSLEVEHNLPCISDREAENDYRITFLYEGHIVDDKSKNDKYDMYITLAPNLKICYERFQFLSKYNKIVADNLNDLREVMKTDSKFEKIWGSFENKENLFICQGYYDKNKLFIIDHNRSIQ